MFHKHLYRVKSSGNMNKEENQNFYSIQGNLVNFRQRNIIKKYSKSKLMK